MSRWWNSSLYIREGTGNVRIKFSRGFWNANLLYQIFEVKNSIGSICLYNCRQNLVVGRPNTTMQCYCFFNQQTCVLRPQGKPTRLELLTFKTQDSFFGHEASSSCLPGLGVPSKQSPIYSMTLAE